MLAAQLSHHKTALIWSQSSSAYLRKGELTYDDCVLCGVTSCFEPEVIHKTVVDRHFLNQLKA